MKINLTINGKKYSPDVEPRLLLIHYLRDVAGLTGSHIGCETSLCGACTVEVNGKSVKSCGMFAVQADGADVLTIEGLAQEGKLHPIQKAFMAHDALQCGFCTPGMVLTAFGLLRTNPTPSREQIIHGVEQNLCRCGAHTRIIDAIQTAAGEMKGGQ